MNSNPKITPPAEISSQHPTGTAKPDIKDLKHCFATFADLVLVSNWKERVVFLNLAAEDLLGFSLSAFECTLFNSQRKLI
jgi:hypothetical protein